MEQQRAQSRTTCFAGEQTLSDYETRLDVFTHQGRLIPETTLTKLMPLCAQGHLKRWNPKHLLIWGGNKQHTLKVALQIDVCTDTELRLITLWLIILNANSFFFLFSQEEGRTSHTERF